MAIDCKDPEKLREFSKYLADDQWRDIWWATHQAWKEGCNTDGFTGLLFPLQGVMQGMQDMLGKINEVVHTKLDATAQGLRNAADMYEQADRHNANVITNAGKTGS